MTPSSRVGIDGPQVNLSTPVAVVLGMVFHELATNAVKHGALSSERGRVQVDWKVSRSRDEAVLTVD